MPTRKTKMQKKNLPLIIGVTIPIVMIILIAASLYIPGLFAHPKYNFIYNNGVGDPYYCEFTQYFVQGGVLQKRPVPQSQQTEYNQPYCKLVDPVKIFLHDVQKNQSSEITFEQAQKYQLSTSSKSPDGFEIIPGTNGGGFIFGSSGDYNTKFLRGHGASKKLNLNTSINNYNNYTFLGWIIK